MITPKVFGLSNWKNGFSEMENTVENIKLWRKDQKLSFGHINFEIFIKHPSRDIWSSKECFRLKV